MKFIVWKNRKIFHFYNIKSCFDCRIDCCFWFSLLHPILVRINDDRFYIGHCLIVSFSFLNKNFSLFVSGVYLKMVQWTQHEDYIFMWFWLKLKINKINFYFSDERQKVAQLQVCRPSSWSWSLFRKRFSSISWTITVI